MAFVEISCGEDNKIRITQSSDNGAREESSFDDLAAASRFLAAALQISVDTIRIGGYVPIGELFEDTRRAIETVSVRVLVIDPVAIHRELPHIEALLDCFRFDELVVHRESDFSCWWKVPPAFIKQSADDVYEDLAWVECVVMGRPRGIPGGIPRAFFSIPSVERLDFVRICPNECKWTKRKPPKYFLALMDFIFEPSPELDYSRMETLDVGVGADDRLPVRFVDDIVEKFRRFTSEERMLPFSLRYYGSLNNIWRSAAENAVKLCPKNAGLKEGDVLYDSYSFVNATVGKILLIDVCYPEDEYPKEVCVVRFRMLDDAKVDGTNEACKFEEVGAKRRAHPVEQLEEVLRFLERFDVEVCQLSCRLFNDIIRERADTLPLHCIGITFDSSSYKDGELVQSDIATKSMKPDWHECNGRGVVVHPSLPDGHYIKCDYVLHSAVGDVYRCDMMKATVGAEVKLMGREDQHYCTPSRRGCGCVPRFVRYANAIAQDDIDSMEALLRLTTNSSALGVALSWYDKRGFVATDAFINAWRRALRTKGSSRTRFQIRDLVFEYFSVAALTPSNFVQFFCDETEVLYTLDRAGIFGSDVGSRARWNTFLNAMAKQRRSLSSTQ